MLVAMPAKAFADWQAYYRLEPWGEWRADLRQGITAALIANVHRAPNTRAYTAQDFMPFEERPAMTDADIEHQIDTFMHRYRRR